MVDDDVKASFLEHCQAANLKLSRGTSQIYPSTALFKRMSAALLTNSSSPPCAYGSLGLFTKSSMIQNPTGTLTVFRFAATI